MERRHFIKSGCKICAGTLIGVSFLTLLDSCVSGKILKIDSEDAIVAINLSEFSKEKPFVTIRVKKLSYDIFVHQKSETEYKAFYMQCTHYDNPVFNNGKEIFCPSHGSKFNFDGQVTKEPATLPLKQLKTEIKNNQILINTSTVIS